MSGRPGGDAGCGGDRGFREELVQISTVGLVYSDGLVGESLGRLVAADLVIAVLGVRSAARGDGDVVVISVASDTSAVTRQRIDQVMGGLPYECVDIERAHRTFVEGLTGFKDGGTWRLGSQDEVAWIRDATRGGLSVTSAIPPSFASYATLAVPDDDVEREASESALLRLLIAQSADQPWWLGYLDTGAHDVVFGGAPTVTLYADWRYVLVEAGPLQAATWREDDPWRGRLPDLIYPADRTWLVSMLWDDDWRCIGGDAALISAVLAAPELDSHSVTLDEDSAPPGHVAR